MRRQSCIIPCGWRILGSHRRIFFSSTFSEQILKSLECIIIICFAWTSTLSTHNIPKIHREKQSDASKSHFPLRHFAIKVRIYSRKCEYKKAYKSRLVFDFGIQFFTDSLGFFSFLFHTWFFSVKQISSRLMCLAQSAKFLRHKRGKDWLLFLF